MPYDPNNPNAEAPNNVNGWNSGAGAATSVASQGSGNGGSYSNQQPGGLSGAMQGAMGTFGVQGPNAAAYNQQMNNAGDYGSSYFSMGSGYGQAAPTIQNPYQQQSQANLAQARAQMEGLSGYYNDVLNGKGPTVAQNQYQQNMDASIRAQMAMANSARGGATSLAGAQRAAQENAGQQMAQAGAQSAMIRAQEQQAAAAGQAGLLGQMGQQDLSQYGLEQQAAEQQAQLALANQGQTNAVRLGLYGLSQNAYQQQQQLLGQYGQQNLNAQQLQLQANQQANPMGLLSGILGAAGGMLAA